MYTKESPANKLFHDNVKLVYKIVHKHFGTYSDKDDLIQNGLLELLKCCERFDPKRGYKFSTYAYKCVRLKVIDYTHKRKNKVQHCELLDVYGVEDEDILDLDDYFIDLSTIEKEIIKLRVKGYTYQEIADKYGRSCSWVQFRIGEIKEKCLKF